MRTIPLIEASVKEFMRDWKSIFLLVVLPLLLISSVFISFNPEGLQKIKGGVIVQEGIDIDEFMEVAEAFMDVTTYDDLDACIIDLKQYKQYVCVDIQQRGAIILDVYYDNTREPVIWEIIGRIKSAVDYVKVEFSKEIASDFLVKFNDNLDKVGVFRKGLMETNSQLGSYIVQASDVQQQLNSAQIELTSSLDQMDRDINDVKYARNTIKVQKDDMYRDMTYYLDQVNTYTYGFQNLSTQQYNNLYQLRSMVSYARNRVSDYDRQADIKLGEVDNKVGRYEQSSAKGRQYVQEMKDGVQRVQIVKDQLDDYQGKVLQAENELAGIYNEFSVIKDIDPETLVNPVIMRNTPVYIPDIDAEMLERFDDPDATPVEKVIKGLSLISLQTIFPTILILITLFLSLLITNFICLHEINSSAKTRIRLVKGIFFAEFFSVFVSSLIIMIIPIMCILLLGNFLFMLPILANIGNVMIVIVLLCSSFILLGMGLAYLIKHESLSLLISTFILVLLIFYSGFLLPIERMGRIPSAIAMNFPGNLARESLNQVVFYGGGISSNSLTLMLSWIVLLSLIALVVKKIRNV